MRFSRTTHPLLPKSLQFSSSLFISTEWGTLEMQRRPKRLLSGLGVVLGLWLKVLGALCVLLLIFMTELCIGRLWQPVDGFEWNGEVFGDFEPGTPREKRAR